MSAKLKQKTETNLRPAEWMRAQDKMKIKNASDLKYAVERNGHAPYFFTRQTMRCFGDTMRNYGIRQPVEIETYSGPVLAYELVRKNPVKCGLVSSAWFDAVSFARVFPKGGN